MMLDRRGMLQLSGGLAAAALSPWRALASGIELPAIPQAPTRRPEPGLIEVDLDARAKSLPIGSQRARLWTYGGSFPGRALEAREGETLRLHFTNRLPEPTNLHFHGLHIPPTGTADNIWLHIPPGERFTYEFTVPKGEAGTYWYHPHLHGTIARQLWAGLAGPIIVRGPEDDRPELAAADERVVMLKDLSFENGAPSGHSAMDWVQGKAGDLILLNGAVRPTLRARTSLLRLRLINACNARYLRLALDTGQPLHLIATDGHFIEQPIALDDLLLIPGARADVLLPLDGDHPLRLIDLPCGHCVPLYSRRRVLMEILPPKAAKPLPMPDRLPDVRPLEAQAATRRRLVTMAMFLINGQPFRSTRIDTTARLGDLELWEVANVGVMHHPFHIHTWYFQVLSRNGRPEPLRAWRDMVNLAPSDRVELLVPMRSFGGKSVYHCHVAEHGDKGMMATLEVVS
jgi:FtsP/CotA-like multicopper oxidase with cupredoxin domain